MVECLGRYVERMIQKGDFVELRPSSKEQTCSHKKKSDDLIVMAEALVKNARNIKKDLEDYRQATR